MSWMDSCAQRSPGELMSVLRHGDGGRGSSLLYSSGFSPGLHSFQHFFFLTECISVILFKSSNDQATKII